MPAKRSVFKRFIACMLSGQVFLWGVTVSFPLVYLVYPKHEFTIDRYLTAIALWYIAYITVFFLKEARRWALSGKPGE